MILKLVDLFAFLSVLLRAGTLVFQSMLIGGAIFVLGVAAHAPEALGDGIGRIEASCWRLLTFSAIGLALVQSLYLYVDSTVLMVTAGLGIDGIVGANFFVSGTIVLTLAVTTAIVATGGTRCAGWALPVLVLSILGASLMTNHAASRLEGRPLLIALSCMHELAAGCWIGGLPFLVLGLRRAKDAETRWYVARRFSRVAVVSVAVLVLSGTLMSKLYIGSWERVLGTAYGVMVTAKVAMLAALLALGGANYLLLRSARKEEALPRLRRRIEAEVGIGITVILTAASLTSQPPAVDQSNQTVTWQQIYQRFKPVVPRLNYRYVTDASNRDPKTGRAKGYDVDGLPLTTYLINNAIESESNHHWMGLIVLAMGLMALLARTGKVPWAKRWPLLLIGVAAFIFLLADTESWPVGPKNYWVAWADPEVFQHRLAGFVCIGFALFESRVRKAPRENDRMTLVFPLMCALGGAVLLTHSHAVTNVKENLLVELSHVPLGVFAVLAGWSRWLELRLPEGHRAAPSWIWPACFVLIGLGLLNYREM